MPTISKENYLKTLYHLQDEEGNISITDISEVLSISKPSVNNMVKQFQKKGWVNYEKYQPINLTEKGKKQAAFVIRKHRLSEMFLSEIMGFGWEEVHEIAEELEHVDSPKFFNRMDELLQYPKFDPHGSPIPTKNGYFRHQNYQTLQEQSLNQVVILKAIKQQNKQLMQFLNSKNIELGSELKLIAIDELNETVTVSINENTIVLSFHVSNQLFVAPK